VQRKKSPCAAPTALTDLDRWRRFGLCLWLGTIDLLEKQEPRALAKLRLKLKRHGLIGAAVEERGRNGRWQDTDSVQIGLLPSVPSDEMLHRAAAFSADAALVPLRGKARPRPPALMMLMAYLTKFEKQPRGRRLRGDSASVRACQQVADEFGYGYETCRKEIRRARHLMAQAGAHARTRDTPR
jgi:hypothetical protein